MQNDAKNYQGDKGATDKDNRKGRDRLVGKFEWSFWANSALSVLGLVLATFLMNPFFEFFGDDVKIYSIAGGFCLAFCIFAFFIAHSVILNREGRSTEQRDAKEEEYKNQLREKVAQLDSELRDARRQIREQEPRNLGEEQRRAILKEILPFAGQKIFMQCSLNDTEGVRYTQQFFFFLQSTARWDVAPYTQSSEFADFDNAVVAISKEDDGKIPHAAISLARALAIAGITGDPDMILIDKSLRKGEIRLHIGIKTLARRKASEIPTYVLTPGSVMMINPPTTQSGTIHGAPPSP